MISMTYVVGLVAVLAAFVLIDRMKSIPGSMLAKFKRALFVALYVVNGIASIGLLILGAACGAVGFVLMAIILGSGWGFLFLAFGVPQRLQSLLGAH